ncbi:DUF5666 domain-containing protein [Patescibacteria group bacterium]|nr:DUF5666 domain-containing protein [Patescibacteria group bacterium]
MNKTAIAAVLALAVGLGAGFFAGTKYQQTQRRSGFSLNGSFRGASGAFGAGARNGMRPVDGNIIKTTDNSITVEMRDGSSTIVLLGNNTTFNKASEAAKTDLKVGDTVAVFGTANSDGSLTARSVSINPVFRGPAGATPSAGR